MRLVICGVGALGSTAALWCRNLDATLRLIDFDRVESKNLLAQAFVKQSIGKNKAEALKLQLYNFYGVRVEAFGVRLAAQNCDELLAPGDLLLDCFDNRESRELLSRFARDSDKPLLHGAISADGTFGVVRWDHCFTPDAEDMPGQATCEGGEHLPMIGLLGATLARAVQQFVSDGARWSFNVRSSGVERLQADAG